MIVICFSHSCVFEISICFLLPQSLVSTSSRGKHLLWIHITSDPVHLVISRFLLRNIAVITTIFISLMRGWDTSLYKETVDDHQNSFRGLFRASCTGRDHPHQLLMHIQSFCSTSRPEIPQKLLTSQKKKTRFLQISFQELKGHFTPRSALRICPFSL